MFNNFTSLLLYLFVAFSSYVFFVFAKQERKINQKSPLVYIAVFIAILIPSIFAGLRYEVGTDFATYNYQMNTFRNSSWEYVYTVSSMEVGYVTLIKILSYFFSNATIFGLVSALTLSIMIYTLLTQYEEADCSMMYFIYLFQNYFGSYNIMRQNIALTIVFFSYKYVYEKNFKKFIICILLASCIHYSSLVFIPAYFIKNRPEKVHMKSGRNILLGSLVFLCVVFFREILTFLSSIGIPFISKYLYLLNASSTAQNRDIYISIIILLMFFLLRKNLKLYDDKNVFLIGLFAISVAIGFTGSYTPFLKRCGLYYEIAQIILMSYIPKIVATRNQRYFVRWVIMIAYMCLFILTAYIMGQGHLIPYKTIFE